MDSGLVSMGDGGHLPWTGVELPKGTLLDGSYRIERVIGSGGFGITYEAEDVKLGTKVAIKEYYPEEFGHRDASLSVRPKSEPAHKNLRVGSLELPAGGAHARPLPASERCPSHPRVRGVLDRVHGDGLRAGAELRGGG